MKPEPAATSPSATTGFVNALTSLYQFTEAVISIYPEIHRLQDQKGYFHGGKSYPGIVIEDNTFDTFDAPLLYAKSTDGLIFRRNTITHNADYAPFHHNPFCNKTATLPISGNNRQLRPVDTVDDS